MGNYLLENHKLRLRVYGVFAAAGQRLMALAEANPPPILDLMVFL